jgi:hypothetical protein
MSGGHSSSRRRSYGRRRKDLRHRPRTDLTIDLEGPEGWHHPAWDAHRLDADPQRRGRGARTPPHHTDQGR